MPPGRGPLFFSWDDHIQAIPRSPGSLVHQLGAPNLPGRTMRPWARYPWPDMSLPWQSMGIQLESVGGTLVLEKAWYRMRSGSVAMGVAFSLFCPPQQTRAHVCCSWPRKLLKYSVDAWVPRYLLAYRHRHCSASLSLADRARLKTKPNPSAPASPPLFQQTNTNPRTGHGIAAGPYNPAPPAAAFSPKLLWCNHLAYDGRTREHAVYQPRRPQSRPLSGRPS